MTQDHDRPDAAAAGEGELDDDGIRLLLERLARPHRSGGRVVERASLLAEGADFQAVMRWIEAHGGEPEAPPAPSAKGGLYGSRLNSTGTAVDPTPLRFILPPAAPR